jgi:hypothetical protein
VADQHHLAQVEGLDELGEVVGVGVQVMAGPGLAGAAMSATVMRDGMAWSSQASAFSGQPWLNRTGCPEPQSL